MDRVEQYLERILKNPGCWVRISKRKGHNLSKTNKFKERELVIKQVAAALDLMGIKYERLNGSKFKIPAPEMSKENSWWEDLAKYYGYDPAKRQNMSAKVFAYGRATGKMTLTGGRPNFIVFDEIIMESPCASVKDSPST